MVLHPFPQSVPSVLQTQHIASLLKIIAQRNSTTPEKKTSPCGREFLPNHHFTKTLKTTAIYFSWKSNRKLSLSWWVCPALHRAPLLVVSMRTPSAVTQSSEPIQGKLHKQQWRASNNGDKHLSFQTKTKQTARTQCSLEQQHAAKSLQGG